MDTFEMMGTAVIVVLSISLIFSFLWLALIGAGMIYYHSQDKKQDREWEEHFRKTEAKYKDWNHELH